MKGSSRHRAPQVHRRKRVSLTVEPDGRVMIPLDLARRYGLEAGAELCVEELDQHLLLHRPVTHLAKVYVEPTTDCPLSCRTCMRNAWDSPNGRMEEKVFSRLVEGLGALPVVPAVFIGGIGEPLAHPGILDMVRRVKSLGARAEMISNGLLLDEKTIDGLIDLELDTLWVSMDGATEECYGNVRETAVFPRIVENLHALKAEVYRRQAAKPELGIAFVSMQRNQEELSRVIDLGLRHGATKFSISNVQPHVEELRDEVVYGRALGQAMGT
jgi:MoaA/NifB/PqqE/SkfB family radical SAM enzyme